MYLWRFKWIYANKNVSKSIKSSRSRESARYLPRIFCADLIFGLPVERNDYLSGAWYRYRYTQQYLTRWIDSERASDTRIHVRVCMYNEQAHCEHSPLSSPSLFVAYWSGLCVVPHSLNRNQRRSCRSIWYETCASRSVRLCSLKSALAVLLHNIFPFFSRER